MQHKSFNFILLFFSGVALLFYSCANIHSLNGGEKDVYPPKDSIYSPLNYSVNFADNSFSIKFDEYITLNDINNQLIVSPPLEHKPKVSVKKKTVFVTFEDTLIPNTTYIFNFGSGIVDYTEGNPAQNLSYVFSTGAQLDSLSIQGKCFDAFTNAPIEGVKVMLYNQDVDSLPMTTKPFYFSMTDKSGNFSVPYMKNGDYKIFCLKDENGNYLYDEDESMGFKTELISASVSDSLQPSVAIAMSVAEPKMQAIVDQKSDSTGFVALNFVKKPKDLSFEMIDLQNAKYQTESTEDSTYLWITSSDEKDKVFQLAVLDEDIVLDTLFLLYFPNEKTTIDWKPKKSITVIPVDSAFVLETYHAFLKTVDTTKVMLSHDSLAIAFEIEKSPKSNRKLTIRSDFEGGEKYQLLVLPQAITTLSGATNDTLKYTIKVNKNSSYGSIKITLNIPDSVANHFFAQLVNDKGDVIYQGKIKNNEIAISQLEAKNYSLRLIEDVNHNQRWDPGNYEEKIQPEKCIYFPEPIQVKPNWALEYDWKVVLD